jgi:hypothetical protein
VSGALWDLAGEPIEGLPVSGALGKILTLFLPLDEDSRRGRVATRFAELGAVPVLAELLMDADKGTRRDLAGVRPPWRSSSPSVGTTFHGV